MTQPELEKRHVLAPPGVHVGRFEVSDIGSVIVITFHGFAGNALGAGPVELIPAVSGVFTHASVSDLRDVCDKILKARQTLSADQSHPQ